MLFMLGIFVILIINSFIYFDHMQHNKELFEDKKLAFNITIILFITVEIFIYVSFYFLALKLIGIFND